jgi:hypothetical protein
MTAYSDIRGYRVKYLASDPTLNTSTEGQVWYNSTEGVLKSLVQIKAFSAGGNMSNVRSYSGGVGTQTDMLAISGQGPTMTTATEEYSGYTWAAGGAVSSARRALYSFGTPTAAVIAGGDYVGSPGGPLSTATEEYDGSAWTGGGTLVSQGSFGASAGTLTAGLAFGGYNATQTASSTVTVSYDGTSWTALSSPASDTNNARNFTMGGGGTQTAAIFSGGFSNPTVINGYFTESWDGSTWTNENNMGTARYGNGFLGTQASGLYAGGATRTPGTTLVGVTEEWDGSNWSTSSASLATARVGSATSKGGSLNAATIAGGGTPYTAATEEYNSNINAITPAAWASLTNFPDSRQYSAGGGTPNSTIVFGGSTGPGLPGFVNTGAEYDGSAWSAMGNYPISVVGVAGVGPITAGLGAGGYQSTAANVATSAEYNGSAWSGGNNANTTGQGAKMTGVQTAALMGNRSGGPNSNESYDGTSWTNTNPTLVSGSAGSLMAGTQTAALMYGAESPPETRTESWDGTSWTSLNPLNTGRRQGSYGGTQTAAILGGGDLRPSGGVTAQTELWNGTSWVTSANMGTARFYQVGGTSTGPSGVTSNIAATGAAPANSNATEEFTGGTEVVTASTLTTS